MPSLDSINLDTSKMMLFDAFKALTVGRAKNRGTLEVSVRATNDDLGARKGGVTVAELKCSQHHFYNGHVKVSPQDASLLRRSLNCAIEEKLELANVGLYSKYESQADIHDKICALTKNLKELVSVSDTDSKPLLRSEIKQIIVNTEEMLERLNTLSADELMTCKIEKDETTGRIVLKRPDSQPAQTDLSIKGPAAAGADAFKELARLLKNKENDIFDVRGHLEWFIGRFAGPKCLSSCAPLIQIADTLKNSKPNSNARRDAFDELCRLLEACKRWTDEKNVDSYASVLLGFKAQLQANEEGRDPSAVPAVKLPRAVTGGNAFEQLRAIKLMVSTVEGEPAGRIGLLGDRVIKFNTHVGERLSFKSGNKAQMVASCNAFRRLMYELLDEVLADEALCDNLKELLGKCDSKDLLDRSVVDFVIRQVEKVREVDLKPDAYTLKAYASEDKDTSFASILAEERKVHPEVVESLESEMAKPDIANEDGGVGPAANPEREAR